MQLPSFKGPMVWYQKFEYAVGHWLQKTAEHVFGSVLCSPGCFSLFRGSALMDDNVLKRYTTTATKASEYVQYDQGNQLTINLNLHSGLIWKAITKSVVQSTFRPFRPNLVGLTGNIKECFIIILHISKESL